MMSEACEAHNHYLNGNIPAEIAENWKEFFPEDVDISYEEFLLQQESVYLSIQAYGKNKDSTSGPTSDKSLSSAQVGESSHGESSHGAGVGSQVELDELYARSLQDLGDDFEDFHILEHTGPAAESRDATPQAAPQATPRATPVRGMSPNIREDDIDPDNMTYEELQSLGEAVGHENRGLPDELISRLPSFKYKTGFFSKKRIKEECVICYAEYVSGARLITLPCAHRYHSACITQWLKLNKTCPVCQVEVQDLTDLE